MKSTPLDIRHQEFPQRFNGYDRHSVRAFLSDVAEEFETLLQRQQEQQDYLLDLEKQLEERKQHEDEIRRAVVSAERIAHELRENAAREGELLVAQASTQREAVMRDAQGRGAELEARHQARTAALEAAFRTRFAELERRLHDLTLERDRVQAQRLMELEREFTERHAELTTRLTTARTEYAHFLSAYRSLMSSFGEMSAQHVLPGASALNAPRLPAHDLLPPLTVPGTDDVPRPELRAAGAEHAATGTSGATEPSTAPAEGDPAEPAARSLPEAAEPEDRPGA